MGRSQRLIAAYDWFTARGRGMFRKKQVEPGAITTLIGPSTRVHGDVEFAGGCLVDGFVKGNVKSIDDEAAVLTISERGTVEGAVFVPNVMVNGTVRGDVSATHRVELGAKARVIGNVQYRLIEMAIGAEVNGKLIHESETIIEVKPRVETVRKVNIVGE
jgi:cytoskeletal protein CcmA (bactofilin family)